MRGAAGMQQVGVAAALLLALTAAPLPAQPARTYANPVDIDYRYNWERRNDRVSFRTGADPVVVRHKGAFYLFLTLADGYWRSTDLLRWEFVAPNRWPFNGNVAPAAWSDGERLYLMQSSYEPAAVLVSEAPETGRWDFLTRAAPPLPQAVRPYNDDRAKPGEIPSGPWDPALFRDRDGRWYLYWGSSNVFPLYGIEVEVGGELGFRYLGQPKPLVTLDPERHGWERFGQDHSGTDASGNPIRPYMEGAWMTEVRGRYYLQYGAPGTEFNAYANGTLVGDGPLGPFRYAPWNPVSYKPGGFVTGAGHGSTFQDAHGNWWNTGTPWVGVNWNFERRVGMWPARFFPDGQMAVSTRFGDFPHYLPTRTNSDPDALFAGWMLLSYAKPATASSQSGEHAPARVTDENPRTYWVARTTRPGETLTVDLGGDRAVRAIQVNYADHRSGRYGDAPDIYTEFRLSHSRDGREWSPLATPSGPRRDRPNAYLELPAPVRTRFVRYEHGHVGANTLAISDLRVFGNADGPPPRVPADVRAVRAADPRNARITWRAVPGAVGYNVRWGVRPDRLTLTYQRWADQGTALELRALNAGVPYWIAVEAFDERGVSRLSRAVRLP